MAVAAAPLALPPLRALSLASIPEGREEMKGRGAEAGVFAATAESFGAENDYGIKMTMRQCKKVEKNVFLMNLSPKSLHTRIYRCIFAVN